MMKDTVQILMANVSAIGISIANVNDWLTFISLVCAICYTVWKYKKDK